MEYPKVYLNWVRFIKNKKLYGAWINDMSVYSNILKNYGELINSYDYEMNESIFLITLLNREKNKSPINVCQFCEPIQILISNLNYNSKSETLKLFLINWQTCKYHYQAYTTFSTINWLDLYSEFIKEYNSTFNLSRKLSRKLSRVNIKSTKVRDKVVQPWHYKSYEKINPKRNRI